MAVGGTESLGEATVKFSSDVVDFAKGLVDLATKADALEKQLQEVGAMMDSVARNAGAAGAAAKSSLDAASVSASQLSNSLNQASTAGAGLGVVNVEATKANSTMMTLAGTAGVMFVAASNNAKSFTGAVNAGINTASGFRDTWANGAIDVANRFQAIGNGVNTFNERVRLTGSGMLQLSNDASQMGLVVSQAARVGADGVIEIGDAVVRTRNELPNLFGEMDNWAPKMASMFDGAAEKVERFRGSLNRGAEDLRRVGTAAGVVGAAVSGFLVSSVKSAIDYESAFAGVRKTTEATEEEFTQMSDAVRGLSKEIPVAATELAGYMEVAGQLGIAKENMLSYTKVVAEMGVATDLAGEEGAAAMARLALVAQVPQNEISNLASSVVALGNASSATESEIVNMAQRLAAAGSTAGLSAGDVTGLAAALSSVGMEAEAGGTAYSKVIMDMAKSVALGGERLEIFAKVSNMTAREFADTWKSAPSEAIAAFVVGLNNIHESGGNVFAVLEELEIKEARLTNALLSSGLAADKFTEYMKQGNDAYRENNALAKEAAERFKTTESQLQLLINKFTDLRITIGSLLLPELNKYMQDLGVSIEQLAQYANDYPDEFSENIHTLVKTAAGLVIFSTVTFMLAGFFTAISGGLGLVMSLVSGLNLLHGVITGTVALSFGATMLIWAGALTVLVAEIYVVGKALKETYDAVKQWMDTSDALNKKTDEYITSLEKAGKITKAQADELRGMSDAQEKAAAATSAAADVARARHAEMDAQLATELQNRLGREATIDELNRARIASEAAKVTAAQAADLALSNLSTTELSRLTTGNAAQQQSLQSKIAYHKKVADESKLSSDVVVGNMNAELQKMGELYATEQELVAAKDFASKYEITLLDGLLAYRRGFSAEQIALIGQVSMNEIMAMQRTDVARKQSVAEEAQDLATRMQNVQAFSEFNTQRIAELRVQREQIITEIQQLRELDNASDSALTAEQQARMTQLTEMYRQNKAQMSVAAQERRDIAVAVEQQISEKEAEALGVSKELARARMDDGEAQKMALAELSEKHSAYVDEVISSNSEAKASFEDANRKTQEEVRGTIAMWAQSGLSVQEASQKWQEAYRLLPPSSEKGGNSLDRAVGDFKTFGDAIRGLQQQQADAMQAVHDNYMYMAPSTPGSPAPLEVARNDFLLYRSELNTLVSATDAATDRMGRAWIAFAAIMTKTAQESRAAMQNMDPTVRHSPSMVDNVLSGTLAMRRIWQQHAQAIWPIMLNAHDAMTYLDPSARHSPSLLERMVTGYAFMTDLEKRMMRDRFALFLRNNKGILESFQKLYEQGGTLYPKGISEGLVTRNSMGELVGTGAKAPNSLDMGKYISMLRELDTLMGGGVQGIETLFLNAINQDAKLRAEEAAKAKDDAAMSNVSSPTEPIPVKVEPPKPVDAEVYKREWLRTVQGAGMLSIPNQKDAGTLSAEAIAKVIEMLQRGGLSPDSLPKILSGGSNISASDGGVVINIEIGSVRTEADIEMIASKVMQAAEKKRWRDR